MVMLINAVFEKRLVMYKELITNWKKLKTVWKVLIILCILLLFIIIETKPWVPVGEDSPDKVMAWCDKNDEKIYETYLLYKLDQGFVEGATDNSEHNVILLANKKSGTYVFRVQNHYVYVVRIVNPVDDRYIEKAIGINREENGKVFKKGLSRSEMDSIDDKAVEDTSWNLTGYTREFHSND